MGRDDKRYSVKRISTIAFLFIAMLVIACSMLISCSLGMQKNILEASSVSYELRILLDRSSNQASLLFDPGNIEQLSDRILLNVRDDLVRTTEQISVNTQRLRTLLFQQRGLATGITPNLDVDQASIEMDTIDRIWQRFQGRVDEIASYNLTTLRAGNKYWRPVDALVANNGALFNSITHLNSLIFEASLQQNSRLRSIYGGILGLILGGIWGTWFFMLRPLARRLSESYLEIMDKNEHLKYQANHDFLTGLSNRASFNHQFHQIEASQSAVDRCCLILIDLDDFKVINDSLGHDAGDAMLKKVAQDLRRFQRSEEHAYRLGGDEFALLIDQKISHEELLVRLDRLLGYVREPLNLHGQFIRCNCSIGIACGGDHEVSTFTSLFKAADTALYRVKQNGRNDYCFYSDFCDAKTTEVNGLNQQRLSGCGYIQ